MKKHPVIKSSLQLAIACTGCFTIRRSYKGLESRHFPSDGFIFRTLHYLLF